MTDAEIIAACEERKCCLLGAAIGGHPRMPPASDAGNELGIQACTARRITYQWDVTSRDTSRVRAVEIATEVGLRSRIEAYLSGVAS